MDYVRVHFINDISLNEPLIAWLAENDFDMFEETAEGVDAYISSAAYSEEKISSSIIHIPDAQGNIRYETTFIQSQNWNKEWESNFEPILVAGRVFVRAPFHNGGDEFQYQITIEPKMSFGTGHHSTTALMIELMLQFQIEGKTVCDMGSGTAILSILAEKLGAIRIVAIDIDEWAYENGMENIERNNCKRIEVRKGDSSLVTNERFDVVLANINRNVLLEDLPVYYNALNSEGDLYLSGILATDRDIILERALQCGFSYITEALHNNWLAMYFKKNNNEG
jgi:ribosomal protein L11 methyltransferase